MTTALRQNLAAAAISSAWFLFVAAPLGYSVYKNNTSNIEAPDTFAEGALLFAYVSALVIVIIWGVVGRRLRYGVFVAILVAIFLCIFAFIQEIDAPLVSDFGEYWRRAGLLAESISIPLVDVYDQRAFPIFYPLNFVFGDGELVYRLFNVSALLVCALCVERIGRLFMSGAAAQAAAVLPLLAPETVTAAGIVNHDIAGLLLLLLGLTMLIPTHTAFCRGLYYKALPFSIVIAVLLAASELQRYPWFYAPMVIVLALGVTLLSARSIRSARLIPVILTALSPLVGLVVLKVLFGSALGLGESRPPFSDIGMVLLAHGHSHSIADYTSEWRPLESDLSRLDDSERRDLADGLLISELADDALQRFRNMLSRSIRLFNLGNQFYFYAADGADRSSANARWYFLFNGWYLHIIAILMLGSSIFLPYTTMKIIEENRAIKTLVYATIVISVSFLSFMLLTLFQSQSRYILSIYFFGSMIAMSVVSAVSQRLNKEFSWSLAIIVGRSLALTLIVAVVVVAGWRGVGALAGVLFSPEDGRMVRLTSPEKVSPKGSLIPYRIYASAPSEALPILGRQYDYFGPYDVSLVANVGEAIRASWRWCGYQPRSSLHFEALGALRLPGPLTSPVSAVARLLWIGDGVVAQIERLLVRNMSTLSRLGLLPHGSVAVVRGTLVRVVPQWPTVALKLDGQNLDTTGVIDAQGRFAKLSGDATANRRGCVRLVARFETSQFAAGLMLALANFKHEP